MEEQAKRNPLPDVLRGFATILVIWGHCIQEGNGKAYTDGMLYFSDPVYKFIYSFHMPLFALIAGYFAYKSLARVNLKEWGAARTVKYFAGKLLIYIIPIFAFSVFDYIRTYAAYVIKYGGVTVWDMIILFFQMFFANAWFLWGIALSFTCAFLIHLIFKDNVLICLAGVLAMFLIPDTAGILFLGSFHACKFIAAFYLAAYAFAGICKSPRVENMLNRILQREALSCLIAGLLFALLLIFYRDNVFVYVSGQCIFGGNVLHLAILYAYRFVVGTTGSLFFLLLFKLLMDKTGCSFTLLRKVGTNSLGMYMIQGYVIILGFNRLTDNLSYSLIRTFLEAVIVTAICYLLTALIARVPYLRKIVGK